MQIPTPIHSPAGHPTVHFPYSCCSITGNYLGQSVEGKLWEPSCYTFLVSWGNGLLPNKGSQAKKREVSTEVKCSYRVSPKLYLPLPFHAITWPIILYSLCLGMRSLHNKTSTLDKVSVMLSGTWRDGVSIRDQGTVKGSLCSDNNKEKKVDLGRSHYVQNWWQNNQCTKVATLVLQEAEQTQD